jgi:anthranilate phosphoribosyltransferase
MREDSEVEMSSLAPFVERVTAGKSLTAEESERCFDRIMSGQASDQEMTALLVALRDKGVVPAEVAGGVRAMRRAMIPVEARNPDELVDTCGTGGGSLTTFNISTGASFVAAAAGVPVAKHGNRSHTSNSGSADVLEALRVRIDLEPEEMGRVLRDVGMVFMFAPLLHPAMRHLADVRRKLGVPTIANILGPLTNPAGARRQVVGVFDPSLATLVVEALRELGHLRALVVHGDPGMDEISPVGSTRIAELDGTSARYYSVDPEDLGLDRGSESQLRGGSPQENAQIILDVLTGRRRDAARTAMLLNAAAAIFAGGRENSLRTAVAVAEEALDSGAAFLKLEELRAATHT